MTLHEWNSEQWLPVTCDELFPFFADAGNLQDLTPSWLKFQIVTPQPIATHVGAFIDYRLTVRGLLLRWRSVITAWEPPELCRYRRAAKRVQCMPAWSPISGNCSAGTIRG